MNRLNPQRPHVATIGKVLLSIGPPIMLCGSGPTPCQHGVCMPRRCAVSRFDGGGVCGPFWGYLTSLNIFSVGQLHPIAPVGRHARLRPVSSGLMARWKTKIVPVRDPCFYPRRAF